MKIKKYPDVTIRECNTHGQRRTAMYLIGQFIDKYGPQVETSDTVYEMNGFKYYVKKTQAGNVVARYLGAVTGGF